LLRHLFIVEQLRKTLLLHQINTMMPMYIVLPDVLFFRQI